MTPGRASTSRRRSVLPKGKAGTVVRAALAAARLVFHLIGANVRCPTPGGPAATLEKADDCRNVRLRATQPRSRKMPTILVIRHAEKPEGDDLGVDQKGNPTPESLIVRGWQRAGALAVFF